VSPAAAFAAVQAALESGTVVDAGGLARERSWWKMGAPGRELRRMIARLAVSFCNQAQWRRQTGQHVRGSV